MQRAETEHKRNKKPTQSNRIYNIILCSMETFQLFWSMCFVFPPFLSYNPELSFVLNAIKSY